MEQETGLLKQGAIGQNNSPTTMTKSTTATPSGLMNGQQSSGSAGATPSGSGQQAAGATPSGSFQRAAGSGQLGSGQAATGYKPTDSLANNMGQLLNSDSLYMQQARQQGLNTAASRGLINSSIASGAAQQQAIAAALPIAQQDTSHQQALKQTEKSVQANIQGAYLDSMNKVMNNAMINVSEIETASGIDQGQKDKMIEATIKRRDADLSFLKDMYSNMPTWANNWTSFPDMPSAPGVTLPPADEEDK